jgi:carbon-monoxide dehydrogenase small subunit
MKIPVTINGEQIQLDASPEAQLLAVLRQRGLTDVKCGCQRGLCGACTVLLNNTPIPACLIPIAAVRDGHIITLGHFAKSDFYTDIKKGFARAGVRLCGICDGGKIFAAYQLLSSQVPPERQVIYETMSQLVCYCAGLDAIVNGVLAAADFHRERESAGGQP